MYKYIEKVLYLFLKFVFFIFFIIFNCIFYDKEFLFMVLYYSYLIKYKLLILWIYKKGSNLFIWFVKWFFFYKDYINNLSKWNIDCGINVKCYYCLKNNRDLG